MKKISFALVFCLLFFFFSFSCLSTAFASFELDKDLKIFVLLCMESKKNEKEIFACYKQAEKKQIKRNEKKWKKLMEELKL